MTSSICWIVDPALVLGCPGTGLRPMLQAEIKQTLPPGICGARLTARRLARALRSSHSVRSRR